MMKEPVTITFKNIIMEGAADDGTLSFEFKSAGDAVITADADTVDKITELLEEAAA